MITIFILLGMVLILVIFPILNRSVTHMEEELISDRLVADIHYIEDLIGDGEWNLQGDAICRGDVVVGDGTQENANLEPFLLHEDKTGTFAYVFIRCGDEGLTYVKSTPTQEGYQQGHFLRVAGSTKDPNGNSIVGTYMDKQVADILDVEDVYGGEANVAGGMIYCRYETLKDHDGNVVGAIVVGRGIQELKGQISRTISSVIVAGIIAIIAGCILEILIMNRWVLAMRHSSQFLRQIQSGDIPEERLQPEGLKEVDILGQSINSLADTLIENEALKVKSETDQATGLANRFGLNQYGGKMLDNCIREKKSFSLGVLDIDYFKFYNDHYGHQGGDECIRSVAGVLKELERPEEVFVARYGGDEFIVMTAGMDPDGLEKLADRIRSGVLSKGIPHAYSKVSSVVTVSQGHYLCVPEEGQTLSEYLSIADKVMYKVKNGTKNSYRIRVAQGALPEDEEDAATTETIDWRTYHDYMTQLLNRDGFYREVERILKENPEKSYYMVRSNIRNFKLVNQLFGYEKGNEILLKTAEMLLGDGIELEASGRIHGDHFAFLISGEHYDEKKLKEAFQTLSKQVDVSEYAIHYALGVYPIRDMALDVSIMCDRANMAITANHQESEFSLSYYDDGMLDNLVRENTIISEFEDALQRGEFHVFLQPIVDRGKQLVGAEALVRWIRDDGNTIVPPVVFIEILEKAGLIHKLDAYVWEAAAKLLARWKGTPLERIFVSVNISPIDINYLNIEKTLEDLIVRHDIRREQLNPEFTESALASDMNRYMDIVVSLREKGFHVELDDFGAGYSSLNMLKDIPVDILKIDKGFLAQTEHRDRNLKILASIIEMSKKLDMTVIAEGVETLSQFENLSGMNCDWFQGYFFSKPVPVEAFESRFQLHSLA